jgi:hypothetical protein
MLDIHETSTGPQHIEHFTVEIPLPGRREVVDRERRHHSIELAQAG